MSHNTVSFSLPQLTINLKRSKTEDIVCGWKLVHPISFLFSEPINKVLMDQIKYTNL